MTGLLSLCVALWGGAPQPANAADAPAPDPDAGRAAQIAAFQELRIVPREGGFLRSPGDFPELDWEQPYFVREVLGDFPLTVRWFDAGGREVKTAKEDGRYGAYIEGKMPGGRTVRRAKTFFFTHPGALISLFQTPLLDPPASPVLGVSPESWAEHRELYDDFARRAVARALFATEAGAILAAGMTEWSDDDEETGAAYSPSVRHQEYHLALKRRVLGVEDAFPDLQRPIKLNTTWPVLADGSAPEAGFDEELPERLREICLEWEREAGEPFTIVVARRGMIVFHEAFGERNGEAVDRDTVYPLLSLTKSLAGIGLLLFLDQDLLDLDAPLGEVLPDFPLEGPAALTLRQCMMHVTGLSGHGNWRGLENPWLDNVIANGLETLVPAHVYSGVAYDLAGMAMQLVSGKSIARLFQEHLFDPLEMKGAKILDPGAGGHLRAIDMARIGQLILNGGSYGEWQFFSRETLEMYLPQPYEAHFPGLAPGREDYGLGIRWAPRRHPHAGEGDVAADATILSPRTIGHGSLSGAVFRVDLEKDTVIAIGRFHAGKHHGEYLDQVLMAVMDSLLIE